MSQICHWWQPTDHSRQTAATLKPDSPAMRPELSDSGATAEAEAKTIAEAEADTARAAEPKPAAEAEAEPRTAGPSSVNTTVQSRGTTNVQSSDTTLPLGPRIEEVEAGTT